VTADHHDKGKETRHKHKHPDVEHQSGLPGRILKRPNALEGLHRIRVGLEPIVVQLNPRELLHELVAVGLTVAPSRRVLHLSEHLVQDGGNLLIDGLNLGEKRLDLGGGCGGLIRKACILGPERGETCG
jgi:hypothetical protein